MEKRNLHSVERYNSYFLDASPTYIPSEKEFNQHYIRIRPKQFSKATHNIEVRLKSVHLQTPTVVYDVPLGKYMVQVVVLNNRQKSVYMESKYRISEGSYGEIYEIHQKDASSFIVKRQKVQPKNSIMFDIQKIVVEVAIQKLCSLFKIGPKFKTLMPFDMVCSVDLIQFGLEKCDRCFNFICLSQDVTKAFNDLKECLLTLHSFGLVHRDVKPDNFLWSPTFQKYVLCDFGSATMVTEKVGQKSFSGFAGTRSFMSEDMFLLSQDKFYGYVDLFMNDLYGLQKSEQLLTALFLNRFTSNQQKNIKQFDQQKQIYSQNIYGLYERLYNSLKVDYTPKKIVSNDQKIEQISSILRFSKYKQKVLRQSQKSVSDLQQFITLQRLLKYIESSTKKQTLNCVPDVNFGFQASRILSLVSPKKNKFVNQKQVPIAVLKQIFIKMIKVKYQKSLELALRQILGKQNCLNFLNWLQTSELMSKDFKHFLFQQLHQIPHAELINIKIALDYIETPANALEILEEQMSIHIKILIFRILTRKRSSFFYNQLKILEILTNQLDMIHPDWYLDRGYLNFDLALRFHQRGRIFLSKKYLDVAQKLFEIQQPQNPFVSISFLKLKSAIQLYSEFKDQQSHETQLKIFSNFAYFTWRQDILFREFIRADRIRNLGISLQSTVLSNMQLKLESLDDIQKNIHKIIGLIRQKKLELAAELIQKSLVYCQSLKNIQVPLLECKLNIYKSEILLLKGNKFDAFTQANRCLFILNQSKLTEFTIIYRDCLLQLSRCSENDRALEYCEKALTQQMLTGIPNMYEEATIHSEVATIQWRLLNYKQALKSLSSAIKIYRINKAKSDVTERVQVFKLYCLLECKPLAIARNACMKLVRRTSPTCEKFSLLGYIESLKNNKKQAIRYCLKSLQFPENQLDTSTFMAVSTLSKEHYMLSNQVYRVFILFKDSLQSSIASHDSSFQLLYNFQGTIMPDDILGRFQNKFEKTSKRRHYRNVKCKTRLLKILETKNQVKYKELKALVWIEIILHYMNVGQRMSSFFQFKNVLKWVQKERINNRAILQAIRSLKKKF